MSINAERIFSSNKKEDMSEVLLEEGVDVEVRRLKIVDTFKELKPGVELSREIYLPKKTQP